jgi:hypothetical protein
MHEGVNMPSFRRSLTFLSSIVMLSAAAPLQAATPDALPPGPAVTAQPGDSWQSIRSRMFPMDALRKANPGIGEMLHPGDVVRSPYVPVAELDREAAARQGAEARLTETRARLAQMDKDRAALEARAQALTRSERSVAWLRGAAVLLLLVAIALVTALVLILKATRAARQHAQDVTSRHRELQTRYDGLRRSLHDVDVSLQRRVVSLLHLHGGKVVADSELRTSMGQVVDFTQELKRKHETA